MFTVHVSLSLYLIKQASVLCGISVQCIEVVMIRILAYYYLTEHSSTTVRTYLCFH